MQHNGGMNQTWWIQFPLTPIFLSLAYGGSSNILTYSMHRPHPPRATPEYITWVKSAAFFFSTICFSLNGHCLSSHLCSAELNYIFKFCFLLHLLNCSCYNRENHNLNTFYFLFQVHELSFWVSGFLHPSTSQGSGSSGVQARRWDRKFCACSSYDCKWFGPPCPTHCLLPCFQHH